MGETVTFANLGWTLSRYSKRALKGLTGRDEPDNTDLIPEGSETGKPEDAYKSVVTSWICCTLAFAGGRRPGLAKPPSAAWPGRAMKRGIP